MQNNLIPKKLRWLWTLFFWLYLFTVLSNTIVFFNPQSPIKIYYQILLGFNTVFLIPYLLNLLAVILDILAIIPFYNFLDHQKHLIGCKSISPNSWTWFFAIRFALIFVGRSYEIKEIQSLLQNDVVVTLCILSSLIFLEGPSHLAVFLYAYQEQNKTKIHHK